MSGGKSRVIARHAANSSYQRSSFNSIAVNIAPARSSAPRVSREQRKEQETITHKIFKYSLPVQEKFTIELPKGAHILRVDDVDGKFWLWATVDDAVTTTESRHMECYKTGQEIHTDLCHLVYLGCCKLFIMQELCLYIFENWQQSFDERDL